MNKELEVFKRVYKEIKRNKDIIGSIEKDFFFNFGDLVIRELEELQEENKKMETEISEHVYWESTPTTELKKLFVSKDKIREILAESKEKEESGAYRYDELYSYLYYVIEKMVEVE